MAFGGVAIGSIKAQLLAIVTGINKCNTGISRPMAIPATTGANTATKATLLMISVMKSIRNMSRLAIIKMEISLVAMV